MISKPIGPYGPGRCPECGAKLSITTPGIPGIECTSCEWSEIYYPPTESDIKLDMERFK